MNKIAVPSLDKWLAEAKADPSAENCGMYLCHNGVVRRTARAEVRLGESTAPVTGMIFSYDRDKLSVAMENAKKMTGIGYVRAWLNEGKLDVGDDIMMVLVGGDIRPHVIDALQMLVSEIKTNCVTEKEIF